MIKHGPISPIFVKCNLEKYATVTSDLMPAGSKTLVKIRILPNYLSQMALSCGKHFPRGRPFIYFPVSSTVVKQDNINKASMPHYKVIPTYWLNVSLKKYRWVIKPETETIYSDLNLIC